MGSMVVFECGQKRLRLAHFQDEAGNLLGHSLPRRSGRTGTSEFRQQISAHRAKTRDAE
jgi:hypothetical protein